MRGFLAGSVDAGPLNRSPALAGGDGGFIVPSPPTPSVTGSARLKTTVRLVVPWTVPATARTTLWPPNRVPVKSGPISVPRRSLSSDQATSAVTSRLLPFWNVPVAVNDWLAGVTPSVDST